MTSPPAAGAEQRRSACRICRHKWEDHLVTLNGWECPRVVTYYAPCEHKQTQGWGSLSSDGTSDGESWCMACGEQIAFRKSAHG